MFSSHESLGQEDERLAILRRAIRQAFPPVSYTGKITRCDGAWLPGMTEDNAIHDDDMFVYEALKNRSWNDVPTGFLHEQQPDGFILLADDALPAYLPAWLMYSLDKIDGENTIREYLVYAFSPRDTIFAGNMLRALSPEQRSVVRSLLAEFARVERSDFIRDHAAAAVKLFDGLLEEFSQ